MAIQTYKILILGPQCSGKTTLVRFLRDNTSFPLIEEDEIFTRLNDGSYPTDIEYKEEILRPKLEEEIMNSENIIFVTSYFKQELIEELRKKSFKIIQLVLDRKELEERNQRRIAEQGYEDAGKWLDKNLKFHKEIRDNGLIDKTINSEKRVDEVAKELTDFIKLID